MKFSAIVRSMGASLLVAAACAGCGPVVEPPTTLEMANAMALSGTYGHVLVMPSQAVEQFKGVLVLEQTGTNLAGQHLLVLQGSTTNEQSLVGEVTGSISERGVVQLTGEYKLASLVSSYPKNIAEIEGWLAQTNLPADLRGHCEDQHRRLTAAWNTPFFVTEYALSRVDDGDLAGNLVYPLSANTNSTMHAVMTARSDTPPDIFDKPMPILLKRIADAR